MIFAGKAVLQDDYAIAYVAEARVIHSHNYGCAAQFHRNFDLAVSQADHPEVFAGIHSEGEGIRLVRQTARYLVNPPPPMAGARTDCKERIQISRATVWAGVTVSCQ